MSMTIPPVSSVSAAALGSSDPTAAAGTSGIAPMQQITPMSPVGATDATAPTAGANDFAASMTGAVDNVQALQENANTLAVQAVTGNLDDIADATIAATRAQLSLQLVSTVRSKAVDAFNQIMNMQA